VTCFVSQLLEIKLTTIAKMSCIPFDIHRSNVQVANTRLTMLVAHTWSCFFLPS
jgi:antitoxin component of RelBE/YafQ-DinJ toxin-antitoxin module